MEVDMKVAIYARKSKITNKGESILNQISLCQNHIDKFLTGVTEVVVFEDEGFSGAHTDRPKFQEMMNSISDFSYIVCYRLDRISRSTADFATMIETLKKQDVGFISINENFDTSTSMGQAMMFLCSVFAQLERDTIAERIRDNMHELAKTGRWLGGTTPTGFSSQPAESFDGKPLRKLEPIDSEIEVVRLIFSKFLEHNSLSAVDSYLLSTGITSKTGKSYNRHSIKNILQNPVYMIADLSAFSYFSDLGSTIFSEQSKFDGSNGMMVYNKTTQKRGKTNKFKPLDEWIVAIGKHKGIIQSLDFIKAQQMLACNKDKNYHKPRSHDALLSGIITCGDCGDYLRPKLTERKNEKGQRIYNYMCTTKERSKKTVCDINNVYGNEVDELVCEQIKSLSFNSEQFIKTLDKYKKDILNENDISSELSVSNASLSDINTQIKNLTSSLAKSCSSPAHDLIIDELNTLGDLRNSLTLKIFELEKLAEKNVLQALEFDLLKDTIKTFADSFDSMNIEEQRMTLRTFVRDVIWDGENVHIHLHNSNKNLTFPNGKDRKRDTNAFS